MFQLYLVWNGSDQDFCWISFIIDLDCGECMQFHSFLGVWSGLGFHSKLFSLADVFVEISAKSATDFFQNVSVSACQRLTKDNEKVSQDISRQQSMRPCGLSLNKFQMTALPCDWKRSSLLHGKLMGRWVWRICFSAYVLSFSMGASLLPTTAFIWWSTPAETGPFLWGNVSERERGLCDKSDGRIHQNSFAKLIFTQLTVASKVGEYHIVAVTFYGHLHKNANKSLTLTLTQSWCMNFTPSAYTSAVNENQDAENLSPNMLFWDLKIVSYLWTNYIQG